MPTPNQASRAAETVRRVRAHLSVHGPWLLRDVLRVTLVVVLGAVSALYLTRWALANRIPPSLAWTLPVAVDVAALTAILVLRRPASKAARWQAVVLAAVAGLLSVAGNGAMHAVDFGVLHPGLQTVVATGAVYPLMLLGSFHVSAGMAPRPRRSAPAPTAGRRARPANATPTAPDVSSRARNATPPRKPAAPARPAGGQPDPSLVELAAQLVAQAQQHGQPRPGQRLLARHLTEHAGRPVSRHEAGRVLAATT